MIAVQIIFIAVWALLAGADECSCSCNEQDVCEEQKASRTKLNNHTVELSKWEQGHYDFVKRLSKHWPNEMTHVVRQQLKVGMTETLEGLKDASQKKVCVTKEDLIARIQSLEHSTRALHNQCEALHLTMKMLSDTMKEIETELHQIPHGLKWGVDFDEGGNTNSVLVWPWMAAVYKSETSDTKYLCVGSIIHRHFVLTLASCVKDYRNGRLSVKLGLGYLKNGTHLQEHRVQSTYVHPQYDSSLFNNHDYNIALLELEEPIKFGPFWSDVSLPPREIPQDDRFYKWHTAAKSIRLKEYISSPQTASPTVVNLTILPQEECRKKVKEEFWENTYPSPDLSFCAKSSSATCPKVGSPLMQSRLAGDGARTWTQVGIRSLCSEKYIFSPRLDQLHSWVDATIADSSKI